MQISLIKTDSKVSFHCGEVGPFLLPLSSFSVCDEKRRRLATPNSARLFPRQYRSDHLVKLKSQNHLRSGHQVTLSDLTSTKQQLCSANIARSRNYKSWWISWGQTPTMRIFRFLYRWRKSRSISWPLNLKSMGNIRVLPFWKKLIEAV